MIRAIFVLSLLMSFATRPGFSQSAPMHFPSVTLPAELDRVLRDYEREWQGGDPAALSLLFTETGFAMPSDRPAVRGRHAIESEYHRAGGTLLLRAIAFAVADSVGYIIGAYRYGDADADSGKFILALQRDDTGRWLIAADIDNGNGH